MSRTEGLTCTERELDLLLCAYAYRELIQSNAIPMNLDTALVALMVGAEQRLRDFILGQDTSVLAATINRELGLEDLAEGATAANEELNGD